MTIQSVSEGIQHVVHLSTNTGADCEHCGTRIGHGELAELANHYITQHGYRLLHTGTETSDDTDGRPWHSTVAVLGK